MVDLSLINAFILRKAVTKEEKMPLFEFKLAVAVAMIHADLTDPTSLAAASLREGQAMRAIMQAAAAGQDARTGDDAAAAAGQQGRAGDPVDAVRYDRANHWPEASGLKRPKCCRVKGCMLRSMFKCSKCGVFLCIKPNNNCFLKYHTA